MDDIQSGKKKAAIWKIAVLCAVSGMLNTMTSYLISGLGKAPLYLDTLYTVAMCFTAGLLPGIITALLLPVFTTLLYTYLLGLPIETSQLTYIFVICVLFEVLLVSSFRMKTMPLDTAFRKNPSLQAFMGLAPQLLVIVALDCIVVSISGGIIDYILSLFSAQKLHYSEDSFKLGLLRNNMPLLPSAIFSRIPINIVDRFIVIFGGYGISLLYRKWVKGK